MELLIRSAQAKDQTEVLALLNGVFSEGQRTASPRDAAYWDWKFWNSPFGPSLLLVAESEGRIVAVNNWWSWEFRLRGKVLRAYQPCDTAVLEACRGKGVFRIIKNEGLRLAREEGIHLIYNYPNKNSLPAYLAMGWHYQQRIPWMVKVLHPLNALRAWRTVGKTRSCPPEGDYQIRLELLEEAAGHINPYDGFIKTNRVEGFHAWRYLQHPYRFYSMVSVRRGRKTCAAVFTINQQGPYREMVVVDLLGASSLAADLMKEVVRAGRVLDVNFVALMQNPLYHTGALWRQGFVPYAFKNMVVLPLDWGLETQVKGYDNWSLNAGMHDSI